LGEKDEVILSKTKAVVLLGDEVDSLIVVLVRSHNQHLAGAFFKLFCAFLLVELANVVRV